MMLMVMMMMIVMMLMRQLQAEVGGSGMTMPTEGKDMEDLEEGCANQT